MSVSDEAQADRESRPALVTLPPPTADVAVIGLGYVGLTLAVALAAKGIAAFGYDCAPHVTAGLADGDAAIQEPGVAETLGALPPGAFTVGSTLPERLPPVVVVCVGTPVNPDTHVPDLSSLAAAIEQIGPRLDSDAVVIVRSTVPVGTTEGFVRERLARHVELPRVAFCPERTIQGQALQELATLPQIVGGADRAAAEAACALFARLGSELVVVSSAAVAEMVKLVCNSHTDVLYGFGNEVALMAEALGVDAGEVIAAANLNYPRPDIARPGFVGGSCLVKDPYLLCESVRARGYEPYVVPAARRLNERVPVHVAERIGALLAPTTARAAATVLLAGIAYKGTPETDDVRGSAAGPIAARLSGEAERILGHDYVATSERIRSIGAEPVDLADGCRRSHALALLVDHPRYREQDVAALIASLRPPRIVYDVWGVWRERPPALAGVEHVYARLGDD